jgi:hypothetical protein
MPTWNSLGRIRVLLGSQDSDSVNREGDYVGRDRKWTNEGGQGGHHKRTALRNRQFAEKGVILRHSNQGKAVLNSLRLKVIRYESRLGGLCHSLC